MRHLKASAVVLTLSLLTSIPSRALDRVVQSSADGSPFALVATSHSTRIEVEGGAPHAVSVPSGAELSAVASLGDAWLTAGVWRRDGADELLLITNEGGVTRRWPSPVGVRAASLAAPTLLSDGAGGLLLAWLEGDSVGSMEVRAAWWEGDRWGSTEVVAPAAPGSQMALTGTVLSTGERLLLWSRFDGRDDEIFWSQGDAEGWSPPRAVAADNSVPDVIPAVVAAGKGAIAAWSRYDGGDYRLVVNRFVDGEWSEPRTIGGPGSLYPSFTSRDSSPHLLYSESAAASWALVGMDEEGRPQRQMVVPGDPNERPLVEDVDASKATLRWVGKGIERRTDWRSVP